MKQKLKKIFVLFAIMIAFQFQNAYSQCFCSDGYIFDICFRDVIPIPGTSVTTLYTNIVATSINEIGSCKRPGEKPPTTICSANAGYKRVAQWEVSGSLPPKFFNVTAKVGETIEVSADCAGSNKTLNDWCQCCANAAGLVYTRTTKKGLCTCPIDFWGTVCSETKSGSIVTFIKVACFPLPCEVDPNCKPCGG
jgi:hypothetical protein